jgi:hypothetical protein
MYTSATAGGKRTRHVDQGVGNVVAIGTRIRGEGTIGVGKSFGTFGKGNDWRLFGGGLRIPAGIGIVQERTPWAT